MLLKYINSNRISVSILIALLPVVFWVPSLFTGSAFPPGEPTGQIFGRIIAGFNIQYRVLSAIIALLLVVSNGYLLIHLNTIHIFIPYRTQLPAFFYVLLSVSITQLHQLTPALVSSTLLIFVFYRILSAYKTDGISVRFLDAGLLISVAGLIYAPALTFIVFLFSGMVLLRPFIWREWVFALIGLAIPFAFMASAYYLLGLPANTMFHDIADSFSKRQPHIRLSQQVNWAYVLFFTLIASYYMANAIDSMKIHARKFFLVFLAFFLITLVIFMMPGLGISMVYYAAVPLSFLFSFYFVKCRRTWINELLFALFLALLIWLRIN